jgi:hypothetical protein
MSGVHVIALVSAVVTLSAILEMCRRRQLREKYALVWLVVCVVVAAIAIAPGLFNRLAHAMGVISPPALLTVMAALFLLVVCVHLSWELGRTEEKTRLLAEEVTLLRNELEFLKTPVGESQLPRGSRRNRPGERASTTLPAEASR